MSPLIDGADWIPSPKAGTGEVVDGLVWMSPSDAGRVERTSPPRLEVIHPAIFRASQLKRFTKGTKVSIASRASMTSRMEAALPDELAANYGPIDGSRGRSRSGRLLDSPTSLNSMTVVTGRSQRKRYSSSTASDDAKRAMKEGVTPLSSRLDANGSESRGGVRGGEAGWLLPESGTIVGSSRRVTILFYQPSAEDGDELVDQG